MMGTVSQNANAAIHSVSDVAHSRTALAHVPCGGSGKQK